MGSNHVNLGIVALPAILVACLVLTGLPGTQSVSINSAGSSGWDQLEENPDLSSPEECARECSAYESPRTCYFHFTIELYSTVGNACQTGTANGTSQYQNNSQCVNADGVERTILSVNRMLPGPSIQVCKGDKVVIDVQNHMLGMETAIHWHGILQKGSQYYDGVPFVTQCPILNGNTFRYQWIAENAGTHFWHSHDGLQKLDGIYGSLIIREPASDDPNSGLYDVDATDHVIVINDWMHGQATNRFPGRRTDRTGQTPLSALINGKGQYTDRTSGNTTTTPLAVFTIKSGQRYRFRMINSFCTVCPAEISIQSHNLTLIATDGDSVKPVAVNTIISFPGERYDFIVNGNQSEDAYWIQLRALGECADSEVQQLGILRYDEGPDSPTSEPPTYTNGVSQGVVFSPLDGVCNASRQDAVCISQLKHAGSVDPEILKPIPDVQILLPFRFYQYTPEELFETNTFEDYLVAPGNFLTDSLINNISFSHAPSPPLSQLRDIPSESFCNGDNKPANCGPVCACAHTIKIPLNSIVELIVIDEVAQPNLSHPFHLHGHSFHVVGMGRSPDTNVTKISMEHVRDLDKNNSLTRDYDALPLKDTLPVPDNGYIIVRFRANNPGWWLFHCHFLYHTAIGMELMLHVGEQRDLPSVPTDFPRCGDHLPEITPARASTSFDIFRTAFNGPRRLGRPNRRNFF